MDAWNVRVSEGFQRFHDEVDNPPRTVKRSRPRADTHARPVEVTLAETNRFGCFVGDPLGIEQDGPAPLDRPGSADRIARIRRDLRWLASETTGTISPSAITYYLERRENLVDEAYAVHGRPGLEAVRPALLGADQAAAVERLRRAAADPAAVRDLWPIQRAKLRALLRDPAGVIPCRSLAR